VVVAGKWHCQLRHVHRVGHTLNATHRVAVHYVSIQDVYPMLPSTGE
jgi:hypothetical protein